VFKPCTKLTVLLADKMTLARLALLGGAKVQDGQTVLITSSLKELLGNVEQETGGKVTRVYYDDGDVLCEVTVNEEK